MGANPLALPPPPGYEQANFELLQRVQRGEITFKQAKKRWRRILRRHRRDLTIQTLAAHLRRNAVLVRSSFRRVSVKLVPMHGFARVSPRGRGRTRRVVRLAAHGPPGRPRPSDDDPHPEHVVSSAGGRHERRTGTAGVPAEAPLPENSVGWAVPCPENTAPPGSRCSFVPTTGLAAGGSSASTRLTATCAATSAISSGCSGSPTAISRPRRSPGIHSSG